MLNNDTEIGLGQPNASIAVYIENIPPLAQYESLSFCRPIKEDEISLIAQQTGNHWRKVFNVYAKLIFELTPLHYDSWQSLRDKYLLQEQGNEKLLFSAPLLTSKSTEQSKRIRIIMGKTYATKLNLAQTCHWLSPYFAINEAQRLIICPYFDYRQLSNLKITQLCTLINKLE